MRSKTNWPPEVAGVPDLLESQPVEAAMLVGGLDDAEREKLHSHMQTWFVRQRRFR